MTTMLELNGGIKEVECEIQKGDGYAVNSLCHSLGRSCSCSCQWRRDQMVIHSGLLFS